MEIKFKAKDQAKVMFRLDTELASVLKQLNNPALASEEKSRLDKLHRKREAELSGIYHQVAVHFADLHDTAERMQEKGVIQVRACLLQWSFPKEKFLGNVFFFQTSFIPHPRQTDGSKRKLI